MSLTIRQTLALARRAIVRTIRIPQAWFPALFFPLVLMGILSGSFAAAPGRVAAFPDVAGFLDFVLAGTVLQGILIGATVAGAGFASDIEGGFFDRLVSSPASRVAIVAGRLLATMALAVVQTTIYLAAALIFGARVADGVGGAALLMLFAVLLSAAAGGLGITLALRTGSAEAVQGTFPLFFALMFFSSAFFPRETMSGWFGTVADLNPISYVVEGMRAPMIGSGADHVALGLLAVVGLAVVAIGAASLSFRRRLRAG